METIGDLSSRAPIETTAYTASADGKEQGLADGIVPASQRKRAYLGSADIVQHCRYGWWYSSRKHFTRCKLGRIKGYEKYRVLVDSP
jgi:hypothetical protein